MVSRVTPGMPGGPPIDLEDAGSLSLQPFSLLKAPPPTAAGAVRNLKGEDVWLQQEERIGEDVVLFALVADGHGGMSAAAYCERHCVRYIIDAAAGDSSADSLRRAGAAAFARLHSEVRATRANDGTTLTVCMVNHAREELTTVHVGDSAAIFVPHPIRGIAMRKPQSLTAEHRLQESPSERKRIQGLGGQLARLEHPVTKVACGPLRVFPGGLAVARGIGDADAGALICPVPACSTVPLSTPGGWDCVLASDGVWDAMAADAVVRLCRHSHRTSPQKTADLIVEQSISKRHAFNNDGFRVPRDDTTCVVLRSYGTPPASGSTVGGCTLPSCDMPTLVHEPVEMDRSFVCDLLDHAVEAPSVTLPADAVGRTGEAMTMTDLL